jgi:hypothetical protein
MADNEIKEEEISSFIGKNAEKYIKKFKKFNINGVDNFSLTWHWPAFFLPGWWFLYRKLYLWALLDFVLNFISFIGFLERFIWAATANYIYYKHVKKKILLLKSQLPSIDNKALSQVGGVHTWVWPVGIIVSIIMFIVGFILGLFIFLRRSTFNY